MPSISVADLLAALLRRWWLVVVVAVPVVLVARSYAESMPDEFESFSVVSLTLEPDVSVSSDLIRLEVQRYAVTLASPDSTRSLAADLFLEPEQLEDRIEVTTPPDTGNIRISVTGETPDLPARVANRLAARGEAEALEDPILRAVVSAQAVPATTASGPARSMITAVGLCLGLLAGAALVMVLEAIRPRVHGLGTLERHAGPVRVLGSTALAPAGRVPWRRTDDLPAAVRRVEALVGGGPIDTLAVVGTSEGAGTDVLATALAPRDDDCHPQGGVVDGRHAAQARRCTGADRMVSASLGDAERLQLRRVCDGGDVRSATAHVCLADADGVIVLVRRGSALRDLQTALDRLDERQARVLGIWLTTPGQGAVARRLPGASPASVAEEVEPASQGVRLQSG